MIMNTGLVSAVRNVIAKHFQIEPERLLDQARFDDLGADWLDRLKLLIAIEDLVAAFPLNNVVADQIETIGDLTRLIEDAGRGRPRANGTHLLQLNEPPNKRT
jgi:acyl carrier protein